MIRAPARSLPDVPVTGCAASAGTPDPGEDKLRLTYVTGLLAVGAAPGTSVAATFHLPDGDFTTPGVTSHTTKAGQRRGYALMLFRLDNWMNPDLIPPDYNVVVDVTARQGSASHHCATEFLTAAD